jgi:hypothetical protein
LPQPILTNSQQPRGCICFLEKDAPFIFSPECIEAFETLKKKLTEAPILVAPDWDLPFELMCDASDFAIGAVLGQRKAKYFQPIHYASKTMTEAQSHYTTTEKELLGVVYAFEKFRPVFGIDQMHSVHGSLGFVVPLCKTRCKAETTPLGSPPARI